MLGYCTKIKISDVTVLLARAVREKAAIVYLNSLWIQELNELQRGREALIENRGWAYPASSPLQMNNSYGRDNRNNKMAL